MHAAASGPRIGSGGKGRPVSFDSDNAAMDGAWVVSSGAIETLIARHIEEGPFGFGPGLARLRDTDLSVWSLVAKMDAVGGDVEEIADIHELPTEAVLAAVYYYWRHREVFDAQMRISQEAFEA